jgi:hypothetical protein
MVDATKDFPDQQFHFGNGPQIGRDNYAPIKYEVLLDPRIKALVEKLAATAPGLAKDIERAARDGIMSPEAIAILDRVAGQINWDVATILSNVGKHINWDVAGMLLSASNGINGEVARQFSEVQHELSSTKGELNQSLSSLRETVDELRRLQAGVNSSRYEPEEAVEFPAASSYRGRDTWGFRFKLFCFSGGLGLLGAILLVNHHLKGYAVFAGVLLVLPVVFSVAKRIWNLLTAV